jgi:flagellar motor protein MotB
MTRNIVLFIAALAVLTAGSGCVPYWVHHKAVKLYEDREEMFKGHQSEHGNLVRRTDEAEAKATRMEIERNRFKELYEKAEDVGSNLYKQIQKRVETAVQAVDLGPEIEGGIVAVRDGKISIAGDVLFALGSANLTDKAKAILKKLAPALKTSFKDECYIRIEGHTDNVPIKNPKTLEKYKTNWHLSIGRALSVLLELKKHGIPEDRMYAAGYGEFKPREPNKPNKKGNSKNRRVEIAIVTSK